MLTSANSFVEFQCFDKKITQSMFLPLKTPIKTKYKCQKTEKVELDNSMQIQRKICGEAKCFRQKSDHVTP